MCCYRLLDLCATKVLWTPVDEQEQSSTDDEQQGVEPDGAEAADSSAQAAVPPNSSVSDPGAATASPPRSSSTPDIDAIPAAGGGSSGSNTAAAASSLAAGGARARAVRVQGNALYKERKWEAALECYMRACELDPASKEAHANSAAALFQLGRWGEAEEAARKVRASAHTSECRMRGSESAVDVQPCACTVR